MWLAYQDRLLTKERLHRLHIPINDDKYSLCDADTVKTHYHLFAACSWISEVTNTMENWAGIRIVRAGAATRVRWIKRSKCTQFKEEIAAAILRAMIRYTG